MLRALWTLRASWTVVDAADIADVRGGRQGRDRLNPTIKTIGLFTFAEIRIKKRFFLLFSQPAADEFVSPCQFFPLPTETKHSSASLSLNILF
jgi:hypothetical protein